MPMIQALHAAALVFEKASQAQVHALLARILVASPKVAAVATPVLPAARLLALIAGGVPIAVKTLGRGAAAAAVTAAPPHVRLVATTGQQVFAVILAFATPKLVTLRNSKLVTRTQNQIETAAHQGSTWTLSFIGGEIASPLTLLLALLLTLLACRFAAMSFRNTNVERKARDTESLQVTETTKPPLSSAVAAAAEPQPQKQPPAEVEAEDQHESPTLGSIRSLWQQRDSQTNIRAPPPSPQASLAAGLTTGVFSYLSNIAQPASSKKLSDVSSDAEAGPLQVLKEWLADKVDNASSSSQASTPSLSPSEGELFSISPSLLRAQGSSRAMGEEDLRSNSTRKRRSSTRTRSRARSLWRLLRKSVRFLKRTTARQSVYLLTLSSSPSRRSHSSSTLDSPLHAPEVTPEATPNSSPSRDAPSPATIMAAGDDLPVDAISAVGGLLAKQKPHTPPSRKRLLFDEINVEPQSSTQASNDVQH